ncbi:hypothetical protein F3Y22_tig00110957pilonHSYRG00017 [Hibiscus syriacus]|uniref:SF4 helicase domain-containing protein n=1 Tax=Hibiscus syriacus TaxID=106335 RepID=A0A6A2Z9K3_HIBSY|nr:hypothetical protein F3Y22_tig00110957pilonHSYRG00017 [Hibiscus syriacus]
MSLAYPFDSSPRALKVREDQVQESPFADARTPSLGFKTSSFLSRIPQASSINVGFVIRHLLDALSNVGRRYPGYNNIRLQPLEPIAAREMGLEVGTEWELLGWRRVANNCVKETSLRSVSEIIFKLEWGMNLEVLVPPVGNGISKLSSTKDGDFHLASYSSKGGAWVLRIIFSSFGKYPLHFLRTSLPSCQLGMFLLLNHASGLSSPEFRLASWFSAKYLEFMIPLDPLIGDPSLADSSSFSESIGPGSPILAELKVVRAGLHLLSSTDWSDKGRLILESDRRNVVEWIKDPSVCPSSYESIVKEIISVVKREKILIRAVKRSANWEADYYGSNADRMSVQELEEGKKWLNDTFYLIRCENDSLPNIEWVLDLARAAVLRHGIQGLVIDPYNELDHQLQTSETETEYVSQLLTKIKRFAQHHSSHVWFVAHPRQLHQWTGAPPNLYDISGSAHFINKCDNGIVIHRNRDPEAGPVDLVQVCVRKVRNKVVGNIGDAFLSYDSMTIDYAWRAFFPDVAGTVKMMLPKSPRLIIDNSGICHARLSATVD